MKTTLRLFIAIIALGLLVAWSQSAATPSAALGALAGPTRAEPPRRQTRQAEQTPASTPSATPLVEATASDDASSSSTITVTLGAPRQLFHENKPDAFGM